MNERGVIRNRETSLQVRNYSGLRFGTITPTDIDGFVEFRNTVFVFFELKHQGAPFPYGQRLALERVCDACHAHRKLSVAYLAEHNHPDEEDIDACKAEVVEIRFQGRWIKGRGLTLKQEFDRLLDYAKAQGLEFEINQKEEDK